MLYFFKFSDMFMGNCYWYCGSIMLLFNFFSFYDLINKFNDNGINKNDE